MNFSASELVKRSASQLLYIAIKQINIPPTINQLDGNVYADNIVLKTKAASEKRGIININNNSLFFCIDMVLNNMFVEIKMVKDTYEKWYLDSSIIQSTLYATLLTKINSLDTPVFRIKEGYKNEIINIPNNFIFNLWFGEDKYKIFPDESIYNHYINKMNLISNGIKNKNFDECRIFDKIYKHKEYNIFNPIFEKI